MSGTVEAPRLSAAQPFRSAEVAWFWCMGFLAARAEGAGAAFGTGGNRPCEPDDVVKALDRLYRQRRVGLHHARVMRIWGERGRAPDRGHGDHRTWREAMAALDVPLRIRGIVA